MPLLLVFPSSNFEFIVFGPVVAVFDKPLFFRVGSATPPVVGKNFSDHFIDAPLLYQRV